MRTGSHIFVLDVADEPAFAFSADSADAVYSLVRKPWFTQALDDFCAKRRNARMGIGLVRMRAATEAEASLYRDRAAEFVEETDDFLIAHIAKP